MRQRLSRAVLMARPTDPGWDFRGAAICPVGAAPAGHLVFAKNDDVISVFSLPINTLPNATDGEQFETTTDGHPIAAFTRDGGLFCLVSSGPAGSLTERDLAQMRDRMEDRVTTAAASITPAHDAVAVDLLYRVSH
jgi:hypothetical protein